MYKLISWSENLDLTEFYKTAEKKGFTNNSSRQMLVDSLSKERESQVWILYYNDRAVGSVAAHSFDDVMGPNSYRIAARTCVFTDQLDSVYGSALRTISVITKHQNPTAQFLIPECINWAPTGAKLYITSNQSPVGTQKRVHNIFGPALEKTGILTYCSDKEYRGIMQSIWKLDVDNFYKDIKKYKRWMLD